MHIQRCVPYALPGHLNVAAPYGRASYKRSHQMKIHLWLGLRLTTP